MAYRTRVYELSFGLLALTGSVLLLACGSSDPTATSCIMPIAPITEGPCALQSASASHLEQTLGLLDLVAPSEPNTSAELTTCAFCGQGSPIVQFLASSVPTRFTAYRINLEEGAGAMSVDYPGFGDEAFVLPLTNSKGVFVENCLGVRQGSWGLLVCAVGVDVAKMQTLESNLLAELGA